MLVIISGNMKILNFNVFINEDSEVYSYDNTNRLSSGFSCDGTITLDNDEIQKLSPCYDHKYWQLLKERIWCKYGWHTICKFVNYIYHFIQIIRINTRNNLRSDKIHPK